jgi:hypothetical protein
MYLQSKIVHPQSVFTYFVSHFIKCHTAYWTSSKMMVTYAVCMSNTRLYTQFVYNLGLYLTSSKLCFRRKDVLWKKTWLDNVFASFKCGSADVVCVCGALTGCVHILRMRSRWQIRGIPLTTGSLRECELAMSFRRTDGQR